VDRTPDQYDPLLRLAAQRLTGHQRRLFQAQVCLTLCDGNPRLAERRFGWGRQTVQQGLHELQSGVRCLENFPARGRRRSEDQNPQLAQDIRAIVEPHAYADPELKSARRYSNLTAAEVLTALQTTKGYRAEDLPSERTMRDSRTQFLKRLVQFADWSGLELRLVYYPPYHSKYNRIERCWSALEKKWNGVLLTCWEVVRGCALRMTWRKRHPVVERLLGTYAPRVSVPKAEMKTYNDRLERSVILPKYDITIKPKKPRGG
jgi:DDE family transposase